MAIYGPQREADRLRVILETLAYAQPELLLKDAVPMIFEIEVRTAELESPSDDLTTARGVALWINKHANKDIQELASERQGWTANTSDQRDSCSRRNQSAGSKGRS